MLRRTAITITALTTAALGAAAVPAVSAELPGRAAVACPTGWGSLAKNNWSSTSGEFITDVRIGTHDCYDRFVVDVPGASASDLGYSVRYVDALIQDPSGEPVPVTGGAILEVVVRAPAYDPWTGTPTYPGPAPKPVGYPTFRDAVYAGSFEGQSQFGLGTRARLPFRVLQLDGRLVVDVSHSW
ncbi:MULTISPECIES: hypothetical protein [unclassified Streptomyces]|uniref:AMIN-like domain-containing (lipo)protein n=1 Tax=unclassified Streptomyces TaxID=2593676 RepID=UPI000DD9566A|nr:MULTISPECIES: hypothetical protein [unclassified Streptomyces]